MTAVQWLFKEIYGENGHIGSYTTKGTDSHEALLKAIEMEKEQIIISDEEIIKASYPAATFAPSFIAGAKWYREQLIKKIK